MKKFVFEDLVAKSRKPDLVICCPECGSSHTVRLVSVWHDGRTTYTKPPDSAKCLCKECEDCFNFPTFH